MRVRLPATVCVWVCACVGPCSLSLSALTTWPVLWSFPGRLSILFAKNETVIDFIVWRISVPRLILWITWHGFPLFLYVSHTHTHTRGFGSDSLYWIRGLAALLCLTYEGKNKTRIDPMNILYITLPMWINNQWSLTVAITTYGQRQLPQFSKTQLAYCCTILGATFVFFIQTWHRFSFLRRYLPRTFYLFYETTFKHFFLFPKDE